MVDYLVHGEQHEINCHDFHNRAHSSHCGTYCSADDAVALATDAGATRLLLFHHHPDRSDSDIDAMVASFANSKITVEGAREGAEYNLG